MPFDSPSEVARYEVRREPDPGEGLSLETYLDSRKRGVDEGLDSLLPAADGPARTVAAAMRYAVFGGGKRLRPILALAACEACKGDAEEVLPPACALELIHTYSLIHDDLPAMDDDDLRRGRATVHRAFNEAAAILAGDALLTLAFEVLGTRPSGPQHAARREQALLAVARCAGVGGMIGGQIADLESERGCADVERVEWIHRHKTGALLSASAELGAIHGGADSAVRQAFARFGAELGLAFQIADDMLDETSTAEELGKTPGKDQRAGKATYPALFGLPGSRERAAARVDQALAALRPLGLLSEPLEAVAVFVLRRRL